MSAFEIANTQDADAMDEQALARYARSRWAASGGGGMGRTALLWVGVSVGTAWPLALGAQDGRDPDRLVLDTPARFVVLREAPEWRLGKVGATIGPSCTIVQSTAEPRRNYYLAAVDSLEVAIVSDADSTWHRVDLTRAAVWDDVECPRRSGRGAGLLKLPNTRMDATSVAGGLRYERM